MAAIICQAFGSLCSATGQVICVPCKVLNLGCESLGDVLCSPFFPYLAVTFGLNMPGLVYGLRATGDWCPTISHWLVINAVLAVVHMVASMYIVNQIRDSTPTGENARLAPAAAKPGTTAVEEGYVNSNFWTPKEDEHGAENSFQRIKHVVCYDKAVAVYIVAFVIWVIWLSVGISRRLAGDDGDDDDNCNDQVHYMEVTIACGYTYMCMVGFAFACSLCCLR
jgi:hypothetical protein